MVEGDENTTNPPTNPSTHQAPHTLSTIKLLILKKCEYDIWAMKIEHYLEHTDYPIWEVIPKGNGPVQVSTDTHRQIKVLPPKTAKEILVSPLKMPIKSFLGLYLLPGPKSKENQDSRRRDAGNTGYKTRDNEKRPAKQDEHKAMVTIDGEGVDWTGHAEDETEDYALMAFNSSNSGLNIEMSAKDKFGLGYGSQVYDGVLSYKNEVFASVFDSRSSDVGDSPMNDRFVKVEGMHAVPPPMIRNYMAFKFDFGIDESSFTYGPKQSTTSEYNAKTIDLDSCDSRSSKETLETMTKPVDSKPKVVNEPKVWSNAPIIEEYESDSDDEYVSKALVEQEKPSCSFINTFKHVKTSMQTILDQDTCSQNPKVDQRDWTGLKSKRMGLGYCYTKKACFVCGSFSHLIRDCDFHEKRMDKQIELNKQKGKSTGPKENRPVWNNVQRIHHQNKFVPTSILTKTGTFPVNAARQNFSSQAALTSTARKVNIARPKMNEIRPRHNVYKTHSPIRRPFNKTTAPKATFAQHNVNTARDKTFSAVGDTECLVLYPDFKLPDENQVLLRFPRQHNRYSFTLENIIPSSGLACLIANATVVESTKWHRRVLVTKPHNKTPYELLTGKIPIISYIRPFGCHVTILNTIDHLGKFEEKSNEGFLVGYSLSSKAFRVYNLETKRYEENLHINFLENKPNVTGKGPTWLFDLDYLTDSMNYQPITVENKANHTAGPKETNNSAGTQDSFDAETVEIEADHAQEYYVLPLWFSYTLTFKSSISKNGDEKLNEDTDSKTNEEPVDQQDQSFLEELERLKRQEKRLMIASYDDEGAVADFTNLETTVNVSLIPTLRVHSIHPTTQILKDPTSAVQTKSTVNKCSGAHAFISQALKDESWVDAMQEELLQFKIQNVWILFDLPFGKKEIRTKWVYRNKKDEKGVVVRNKVRLVAQVHRQEEGIDYDEVFDPVARIDAIRIFLSFASYMGFKVVVPKNWIYYLR
uniref:Uncharacterized protein n=1 Tax=Tanacetum cinerariifolium TaxID=118510 RepID=A0A6L2KHD9_TANCI|nr:hypothetical protein [Tanacetum cinerariifolium]